MLIRNLITAVTITSVLAAVAPSALAAADAGIPVTVTFAPRIAATIHDTYGPAEAEVLREAVRSALSDSLLNAGSGRDVKVAVEVTNVAPTHPTRQQSVDSPSLGPIRSRSLGGAALTGTVRGPNGQVLATLNFERFAPDLSTISSSIDAWADARLAIRQFASQLAKKTVAAH